MILNISVRAKHQLIMAVVAVSFLVAGLIFWVISAKIELLHKTELQLSELKGTMLLLRRHEKDFLYRDEEASADAFKGVAAQGKTQLNELQGSLTEAGLPASAIQQIGQRLATYESNFLDITALQPQARKALGKDEGLMGSMRDSVRSTESLFADESVKLQQRVEQATEQGHVWLATLLALIAVGCVGSLIWVSRSIYVPLEQLSRQIADITQRRDLTAQADTDSNDEIGAVARSFNELLSTLRETILEVLDGAHLVASSAEEMANITRDVRQATATQSREVDMAAVAVNEMTSTIQEIARNASGAADSVSAVHQQLQAGSATGTEARREIEKLTEEVQEVVEAIQTVSEHSNNIGQVLDAIRAVAEQTNLLALNAAIEAARAGDQGRGFAVVADEVRTLAKKTQDSTETIRQTIQQLQQGTQQAVGTVDRASHRASQGIEQVSRTAHTLNDIAQNVSSISDLNLQIAAAAEQQGLAAEEISRNVVRVTDLSRQVAGQAEQTALASSELAQLGTRLQDLVKRFRV